MSNKYISKKLKKAIYDRISYTNLDYDSIMSGIIEMFFPTGGREPISYSWDNVSEADPFFIQLHLLAAHIDILNYMIDYRVRESFMSTAVERASMVRHANSRGYKIPSYFPAVAKYKYVSGADISISKGTIFTGADGLSYTYLGEDISPLQTGGEIDLVQGHRIEMVFNKSLVEETSRTKVISNFEVAVMPHEKAARTSYLTVDNVEYTEVPNLATYNGNNRNVYELNVDPYRQTYIKFLPEFFELSGDPEVTLNFIITDGRNIVGLDDTIVYEYINNNEETVEAVFELVDGSVELGRNPAEEAEIKDGFINFCITNSGVVTLRDYYNQLFKYGNTELKALTIDSEYKYTNNKGYEAHSENKGTKDVRMVVNSFDNTKIKNTDFTNLVIAGVTHEIVESIPKNTYIKLGASVPTDLKYLIMDYINNKDIGSKLTVGEISHFILRSQFGSLFTEGLDIKIGYSASPNTTADLVLAHNEEFKVGSIDNIVQ